jgi:hypothetical protein
MLPSPLILPEGDREDPPDAARQDDVQITTEGTGHIGNGDRHLRRRPTMPLPGVLRVAVDTLEAGAGKGLLAGLAILRQKVRTQPIDERPKCRLTLPCVDREALIVRTQPPDVGRQHGELRMQPRPVREKHLEAAAHAAKQLAKPVGGAPACDSGRQISRTALQVPPQGVWRHQPPIEQRAQPVAQTPFSQLREHQRDIVVVPGKPPTDAKRLIERFVDEPRHVGLVREVESRIDVGFEGKFAEQREAERIDGGHGDVPQSVLQAAPPLQVDR